MKYVVKDDRGRYLTPAAGEWSTHQNSARVFDEAVAKNYAYALGARVVRLVPRKPKPVEPEKTIAQIAHAAMWPEAPQLQPSEYRWPQWERVASAVVAEHERRKAGAK